MTVRVVIHSEDVVDKAMSGPAIRCWEFAKELSKFHQITLITPNKTSLSHPAFKVVCKDDPSYASIIQHSDVLITHHLTAYLAYLCKKNGVRIILDAYCPLLLEVLETFKDLPKKKRNLIFINKRNEQLRAFAYADRVICASEKQRDLWLGLLSSLNKLQLNYEDDPTLRKYIDVVPFGLSSADMPPKNGPGPRELFNLKPEDKIILWGGSISNWFDPSTLIYAMHEILKIRSDIKLVFLGVKHPNANVPQMSVAEEAILLAKKLGLYQKDVFFNYNWTPYNERHNFLNEAFIGISTHSEHLETLYSFRTRILDYLWAGLPIISTEGDSFAEMVHRHDLGIVVPYRNSSAIAQAILKIADDKTKEDVFRKNCLKIRKQFEWETVTFPINRMIEQLSNEKKRISLTIGDLFRVGESYWESFKLNVQTRGFKTALVKTIRFIKGNFMHKPESNF